ncbi:LOG family protein [Afifella pfennigii]|uniref:LOG family protein n=1 Tax=Afifella pfennigii TaxID=209897 RepID=UPI00047BA3F7|nr:TIGR00730 family Rossman fold protein [Afifella pfennigii]
MQAICVFCGSNEGARPDYALAARALARELAGRGVTLVYGGAKVGLMGILADAALAAGGEVVGVMPRALIDKEVAHEGLTRFVEVDSMHARKATMSDLAAGFIALPGGAGTLEELFEVWTWGQLGHHAKPVGLLNVAGFYDRLAAFLDHQAAEAFMRAEHRQMLMVEATPEKLLDRFIAYQPPRVEKWISAGER